MINNENIKTYLDIEDGLVCSNAQWPGTVSLEGHLIFPCWFNRRKMNYNLHITGDQK